MILTGRSRTQIHKISILPPSAEAASLPDVVARKYTRSRSYIPPSAEAASVTRLEGCPCLKHHLSRHRKTQCSHLAKHTARTSHTDKQRGFLIFTLPCPFYPTTVAHCCPSLSVIMIVITKAVLGTTIVSLFNAQFGSSIDTTGTAIKRSFLREKTQALEGKINVCAIGSDRNVLENAFRDDPLNNDWDLFTSKSNVMINLVGARVTCYDEDTFSSELMGWGVTNEDGCATVVYDTNISWDGFWGNADIFCAVSAEGYHPMNTNRLDDVAGSVHMMDTVTLPLEACGSTGFITAVSRLVLPDSFQPACALHDLCYETCGVSKHQCDLAQSQRTLRLDPWASQPMSVALRTKGTALAYVSAQANHCDEVEGLSTEEVSRWGWNKLRGLVDEEDSNTEEVKELSDEEASM